MRLPAPNRQRLLWLLSQLLEHQLSAAAAQGGARGGGGERGVCSRVGGGASGTQRTCPQGTGSASPSCTCANRRCNKSWSIRNPPACTMASCDGRSPGGGLRPACW